MNVVKSIFIGFAAYLLVACASTPNPLSGEARDQFFVKSTQVTWALPEKEEAVEAKKDANDDGKRAEGRKDLEEKLNLIVADEFANSPSGPTPVDFNIAITRYDRVGAGVGKVYEDVKGIRTSGGGVLGAVIQAASKPDIEGLMATSFAKKLRKRFDKKQ